MPLGPPAQDRDVSGPDVRYIVVGVLGSKAIGVVMMRLGEMLPFDPENETHPLLEMLKPVESLLVREHFSTRSGFRAEAR